MTAVAVRRKHILLPTMSTGEETQLTVVVTSLPDLDYLAVLL
jgi:hypothetical protein